MPLQQKMLNYPVRKNSKATQKKAVPVDIPSSPVKHDAMSPLKTSFHPLSPSKNMSPGKQLFSSPILTIQEKIALARATRKLNEKSLLSPKKTPTKSPAKVAQSPSRRLMSPSKSPFRIASSSLRSLSSPGKSPKGVPKPALSIQERIAIARAKKQLCLDSSAKSENSSLSVTVEPTQIKGFYGKKSTPKPAIKNVTPKKRGLQAEDVASPASPCSPSKVRRRQPTRSTPKKRTPAKASATKEASSARTPFQPTSPHNTPTKAARSSCQPKKVVKKLNLDDNQSPSKAQVEPVKVDVEEYQYVQQRLHSAVPDRLLGRETERGTLLSFLDAHIKDKTPGSLYISGAPGTGKTAVLGRLLEDYKENNRGLKWSSAFVNCMSAKIPNAIYAQVLAQLKKGKAKGGSKGSLEQMKSLITTSRTMIVVTLDEADQLDCTHQEVLYSLFELPAIAKSKLVLITIANSLDMTDRLLPRLHARPQCRPELLHFAPYTCDELLAILRDRVEGKCVMEAGALELCARKVSAVAGDARKALDVCRTALDLLLTRVRTGAYPQSAGGAAATPRVTVSDIAGIMAEVLGGGVGGGSCQHAPVQQLVAACALSLLLRKLQATHTTLGKLHVAYAGVCQRQQITPCDVSEFVSVCQMLETRSVFSIKRAKEARMTKISMALAEGELEHALGGKALLANILRAGL